MKRYKYPTINTDTYTLNERNGRGKGKRNRTEDGMRRGEEEEGKENIGKKVGE